MTTIIRGSDNFDTARVGALGLTRQNVTAQRALGVTYTNATDREILVYVRVSTGTLAQTVVGVLLDSEEVLHMTLSEFNGTAWTNFPGTLVFRVLPGGTYRVRASQGVALINSWWEERA